MILIFSPHLISNIRVRIQSDTNLLSLLSFYKAFVAFISIKIRRITLIYVSKNLPFKSQVTHKLLENSNFCNHINYYWKQKKQENIGSKTQLVLSQLFAFIRFALWTHWVTCFDKKCETEARLNSINFFQQFIEFYIKLDYDSRKTH